MRNILRLSTFLSVLFIVGLGQSLFSNITFGSRESAIKVQSGTTFNISSDNLCVDGTIDAANDASITGKEFAFKDGRLRNKNVELCMTALYDPTGTDIITLPGKAHCDVTPGTVIQAMVVEGVDNELEGQPRFSGPITLANDKTELSIGIQNKLNNDIELNGGKLILIDNLGLVDDVKINGPGIVDLNQRQLSLGSVYTTPWGGELFFDNATDLVLTGNTVLTGTWTFTGKTVLNGNGSVLDMSGGGKIIVKAGATLCMNDIHVTGLADAAGKGMIVFEDKTSQLRIANASFKLDGDMSWTTGGMYVVGPATLMLGNYDWTFDTMASLTVDGVPLWLDTLCADCAVGSGQLFVNLPLFANGLWQPDNVTANIAAGYLSLIDCATIKDTISKEEARFDQSLCELLSGCLTDSLKLNCGICLCSHDTIRICGDVEIDGQGNELCFLCGADNAQLIVEAGNTLTLKNIALNNIGQNTLDIRDGALLNIDEDVSFCLCENVTFSQGAIQVLNSAAGSNIFTIKGDKCKRVFDVRPLVPLLPSGVANQLLFLGTNTLKLENAGIGGFASISHINGPVIVGAIALSCQACAFIDVDTGMNFFIEDGRNEMIFEQDGLIMSGNISFGDFPDNELSMRFLLIDPIDPNNPRRVGVKPGNPFVEFTGDPGVFVFSLDGRAHLIFEDFSVTTRLSNANGIVVDDNSLLTAKKLEILDNPIKQASGLFRFEAIEIAGAKIDPSFVRSPVSVRSALRSEGIKLTALHIARQKEKEQFLASQAAAIAALEQNGGRPNKPNKPSNNNKPQKPATAKPLAPRQDKPEAPGSRPEQPPRPPQKPDRPEAPGRPDRPSSSDNDRPSRPTQVQNGGGSSSNGRRRRSERSLNDTTRAMGIPSQWARKRGDLEDPEDFFVPEIFDEIIEGNQGGTLLLNPAENEPLKGALDVRNNARIEEAYTDPDQPFHVVLSNESELEQSNSGDIDLEPTQIISVIGKQNVVEVCRDFRVNQGNLLLSGDAECIIRFANNGTHKPRFIFSAGMTQNIGEQGKLIFEGDGYVVCEDGVTFQFLGQPEINPETGRAQTEARPSIIIRDDAKFVPAAKNAKIAIQGVGNVSVEDRAMIKFDKAGSKLRLGSSTEKVDDVDSNKLNDIMLNLIDGVVWVESDDSSNRACISLEYGTFDINGTDGGRLLVGDYGTFAINGDCNETLKQGRFNSFDLGCGGQLNIRQNGLLLIGASKEDPKQKLTGKTCYDFEFSGQVQGSGLVGYLPAPFSGTPGKEQSIHKGGLLGRLIGLNEMFVRRIKEADKLSSESIVRNLVQSRPGLSVSTVFVDEDGAVMLRTKNGTTVPLVNPANNNPITLVSDSSTTGQATGTDGFNAVTIDINGNIKVND
ncbi:MAG: hypothetical protein H6679_03785 [Epsilonproteobacteria bacterium]|nr:hypothetical protein [Campylobacterota bacterium]